MSDNKTNGPIYLRGGIADPNNLTPEQPQLVIPEKWRELYEAMRIWKYGPVPEDMEMPCEPTRDETMEMVEEIAQLHSELAAKNVEIAALQDTLATARRDALEEAADIAICWMGSSYGLSKKIRALSTPKEKNHAK